MAESIYTNTDLLPLYGEPTEALRELVDNFFADSAFIMQVDLSRKTLKFIPMYGTGGEVSLPLKTFMKKENSKSELNRICNFAATFNILSSVVQRPAAKGKVTFYLEFSEEHEEIFSKSKGLLVLTFKTTDTALEIIVENMLKVFEKV